MSSLKICIAFLFLGVQPGTGAGIESDFDFGGVEDRCKQQLQLFHECTDKLYAYPEQMERLNRTNEMFKQCYSQNGCKTPEEEPVEKSDAKPHSLEFRKKKCQSDIQQMIQLKIVTCVKTRISFDFEYPPVSGQPYGRYLYEWTPSLEPSATKTARLCANGGDARKLNECFLNVTLNYEIRSVEENAKHYDVVCRRRDQCFQLLDEFCVRKNDLYREEFCRCSYDVHEFYGGRRLYQLVPSCREFASQYKTPTMVGNLSRDECGVESLNSKDFLHQVCPVGYEKFYRDRHGNLDDEKPNIRKILQSSYNSFTPTTETSKSPLH